MSDTRLRLKGIVVCSFQRSEATNLDLYKKEGHFPGDLKKGEAYLVISKGLNQIIFVFPPVVLDEQDDRSALDSRRLRLDGGTWHPYMLQNYAESLGIHLVGIKSFEKILEDQRDKKRNG